jgi:bifunctional DNase/RNase
MLIEMTIKGLMVDPVTNMPIVILKDKEGDRVLPIWVGIFEANAIALQIENVATPRPMTHDLLRNVIHDLNAVVQKIVVCDLQENTFYALIYLALGGNGDTVAIDARPSDAIALALRTRAPIFVEEAVIDSAKTLDPSTEVGKADADRLAQAMGPSATVVTTDATPTLAVYVPDRPAVAFDPNNEATHTGGARIVDPITRDQASVAKVSSFLSEKLA